MNGYIKKQGNIRVKHLQRQGHVMKGTNCPDPFGKIEPASQSSFGIHDKERQDGLDNILISIIIFVNPDNFFYYIN